MKTFIHDMKVLKYYKGDEFKSIILFCFSMVIASLTGKLLEAYKMISPIIDLYSLIWMALIALVIPILMYSARYFMLDRKMLREIDKEFDAELKWSSLLRDFNKKDRL